MFESRPDKDYLKDLLINLTFFSIHISDEKSKWQKRNQSHPESWTVYSGQLPIAGLMKRKKMTVPMTVQTASAELCWNLCVTTWYRQWHMLRSLEGNLWRQQVVQDPTKNAHSFTLLIYSLINGQISPSVPRYFLSRLRCLKIKLLKVQSLAKYTHRVEVHGDNQWQIHWKIVKINSFITRFSEKVW